MGITQKPSFLSVCMNPTFQKTLCFKKVIPGEVNRAADHRLDVSGKGINVSRVLSQLGKNVVHLTQLGGALRPYFIELCEKDGLNLRWVESGSPIRYCYTIIAEGESRGEDRSVTEFVEEGEPVAAGTEERLLAAYTELLGSVKTVIISGTKARGFTDALVPAMVRLARAEGKRIILDIRGSDLKQSLPYRPDVIKPNLFEFVDTFAAELEQCARTRGKTPPDYKNMGELSGEEPGVKEYVTALALDMASGNGTSVVLSRGKRPVWFTGSRELFESPIEEVRTVNTIGCGDAFTAGLAAALDEGCSLRDAVARGIHCGSLNAGFLKPGIIRDAR